MMEVILSSKTSVPTRATRHQIPESGILYSHRHENLKSYILLTSETLYRRRNLSLVRYELGFYIPEDTIRRSHRREHINSYEILHPSLKWYEFEGVSFIELWIALTYYIVSQRVIP
jgi:hypothetical protein